MSEEKLDKLKSQMNKLWNKQAKEIVEMKLSDMLGRDIKLKDDIDYSEIVGELYKTDEELYEEQIEELQQRIDKAIEYIKECMETTHKINDYWTNELVNGSKLLEILGDKE